METIPHSVYYETDWLRYPHSIRKHVVFVLMRSQKSFYFTGYQIFSCTLATFTTVTIVTVFQYCLAFSVTLNFTKYLQIHFIFTNISSPKSLFSNSSINQLGRIFSCSEASPNKKRPMNVSTKSAPLKDLTIVDICCLQRFAMLLACHLKFYYSSLVATCIFII